jgi:CRP/FNR family cyclic AMP-dependent transcriptional regulator
MNQEFLKATLLFRNLESPALENILRICTEKKFRPGDVLCGENTEADAIIILKSGLVRISKGIEAVEITTFGPGEAFGELSFLDHGIRSATVTAVEETCAFEIPYKKLSDLLEKDMKLAKEFYKNAAECVSQRIRKTTDDLQFSKEFVAKYVKYF